jgi:hypothetical protein
MRLDDTEDRGWRAVVGAGNRVLATSPERLFRTLVSKK